MTSIYNEVDHWKSHSFTILKKSRPYIHLMVDGNSFSAREKATTKTTLPPVFGRTNWEMDWWRSKTFSRRIDRWLNSDFTHLTILQRIRATRLFFSELLSLVKQLTWDDLQKTCLSQLNFFHIRFLPGTSLLKSRFTNSAMATRLWNVLKIPMMISCFWCKNVPVGLSLSRFLK